MFNYIISNATMHTRAHTHTLYWNWQGLCHCYITHLLPCCRVLTITFQSAEPAPSAAWLVPPWTKPSTVIAGLVCAYNNNPTSHFHVSSKIRPSQCWLWSHFSDCQGQLIQRYVGGGHRTDAGAAACLTQITAGSSLCSQPDRLHQLYKQYEKTSQKILPWMFTLKWPEDALVLKEISLPEGFY